MQHRSVSILGNRFTTGDLYAITLQSIKTVQGLESVGGSTASQACFKIADNHRVSGDKGKEVQQLRLVLRRYPKSGESSSAHDRLESYGVKVTGGEAVAED